MKHRISRTILMCAVVLIAAAAPKAFSYAYNPWTGSTGAMKLAVNPFFYSPTFSPFVPTFDLAAAYGVTANFDVIANFATLSFPATGFAYGGSWVMPRFDIGGNNIFALQIKYTPAGAAFTFDIVPQYHFFWENDYFAAEANVYMDVPIASAAPNVPYVKFGAYLAPVVKVIKDLFYIYCEIDPAVTSGISSAVQSKFELVIVPGVTILLGGATHQLSIAVPLGNVMTVTYNTVGAVTPGLSIWYWTAFDFGGGKK